MAEVIQQGDSVACWVDLSAPIAGKVLQTDSDGSALVDLGADRGERRMPSSRITGLNSSLPFKFLQCGYTVNYSGNRDSASPDPQTLSEALAFDHCISKDTAEDIVKAVQGYGTVEGKGRFVLLVTRDLAEVLPSVLYMQYPSDPMTERQNCVVLLQGGSEQRFLTFNPKSFGVKDSKGLPIDYEAFALAAVRDDRRDLIPAINAYYAPNSER